MRVKKVLCGHTRRGKIDAILFCFHFILPFLAAKHNNE